MSRRRLERGYWNGRQVGISDKEYRRIYVQRPDRDNRWYHRHALMISMEWPFPDEFRLIHRLPRKTKKALWKKFNGHPKADPRNGVFEYRVSDGTDYWQGGIFFSTPGLLHKGKKPRR